MAFHLNVSNSLNYLAGNFIKDMARVKQNVFQPHYIISQTEGMNNWLKNVMAHQVGISANCRFLKPNDFINQLYHLAGGQYPDALTPENMTWLLFKLLGDKEFITRFASIAGYYNGAAADGDIRRLSLAEKMADLFDQYQIYRPKMIAEWNNAATTEGITDWQKYLWIKAIDISGNKLPDKTSIGVEILKRLKDEKVVSILTARMPAVNIFGLSVLTQFHLQILQEAARHIDVSFYLLNPAPSEYWFEDRTEKQLAAWKRKGFDVSHTTTGNPLLTNWGKLMQNTFNQLFENDELLNAYNETGIEEPLRDTLLHKIQNDIFHNKITGGKKISAEDVKDDSITISACYTIAREVEVLYNYLVYLVDKRKEKMSPRDVVVMVTDINAYAPYIKAIFDNAPYVFPLTIADESFTGTDTITNALAAILEIDEDNFKAEEVLQLLDSSFIKSRFGITDLALIRTIVDQANIRFGIEGSTVDDTRYVSWSYGLQRILYGICMNGSEEYAIRDDTIFPLDSLEGNNSLELIRFAHFITIMIQAITERKNKRSLSGWVEYTEEVLHNLVCEPGEETNEDYFLLIRHLEKLNETNEFLNEEIAFEVFRASFTRFLSATHESGTFSKGGITFCSLIPMRSIPFKVVAMLGVSYDKFPRKEIMAGFSLMEARREKGDRNVKENDKHLFLEVLLSAKDYLYISYVGRNPQDNTEIPPSALVDELLDYIVTNYHKDARQWLITGHPLQGFSSKYNSGNERMNDYTNDNSIEKKHLLTGAGNEEKNELEEILLQELIRFFNNPFREYYKKVLGISYRENDLLLSETEMFEVEKGLEEWRLKKDFLLMDDVQLASVKNEYIKTGRLPLKNMAAVALQRIDDVVRPVRETYRQSTAAHKEGLLNIALEIDGSKLTGTVAPVFGDNIVVTSLSKNETKYLLEAAILYLAAISAGYTGGVHFISLNKGAAFPGKEMAQKQATAYLTGLIRLYKEGHTKMLAFLPDIGKSLADIQSLDYDRFCKILEKKADYFEECIMNEYNNGFFAKEAFEEYQANATIILTPVETIFADYYTL